MSYDSRSLKPLRCSLARLIYLSQFTHLSNRSSRRSCRTHPWCSTWWDPVCTDPHRLRDSTTCSPDTPLSHRRSEKNWRSDPPNPAACHQTGPFWLKCVGILHFCEYLRVTFSHVSVNIKEKHWIRSMKVVHHIKKFLISWWLFRISLWAISPLLCSSPCNGTTKVKYLQNDLKSRYKTLNAYFDMSSTNFEDTAPWT